MIFHRTEEEWKQEGGYWTAKEIFQQPETWRKTLFQIREERFGLQAFINTVKAQKDYDIVFAGAGTSEYIGNELAPALRPYYSGHIRSCATTDIVSNPEYCLFRDRPTLLVSFGRSGNSPESIGAIRAAENCDLTISICAFNNNSVFLDINGENLSLLINIFTGNNLYQIVFLNLMSHENTSL